MANDQELAGLPEDVREAVRTMDAGNTVNRVWHACRDELTRLARENAEYHEKLGDALGRETRERLRAERAEAELAALKRRIAEAATVHVDDDNAIETLLELGYYKGQRVALLPVGGE